MSASIQVEQIQEQDFTTVAELYRSTIFENYTARFKAIYLTDAGFRDMSLGGVMILIARQGANIVGAIGLAAPTSRYNYTASEDQLQGMLLAVDPSTRKQGVATALIQKALQFADTAGYDSVSAAVLQSNKKMQDLISKIPGIEIRGSTFTNDGKLATLLSVPVRTQAAIE